jgi:hypothetical protein
MVNALVFDNLWQLAPMGVCFDVQATWAEWFLLASLSCDCIFIFDIYTRFYSAFFFLDSHGEWKVEDRPKRCRSHYVDAWRVADAIDAALAWLHSHGLLCLAPNRPAPRLRPRLPPPPKSAGDGRGHGLTRPDAGWFWLDLITSFPAEIFLAMVRLPADPYYRAKAWERIGGPRTFLRLLQGVKVLRIARLRSFLDMLQRSRSTRLAGGILIKVVLYSLLWVHWVGCLWFLALRAAASTDASSLPPANSTYTPPPALHADQAVQGLGAAVAAAGVSTPDARGMKMNQTAATSAWWTCDDREKLLSPMADAGGRYVCALHWATQTMLAVGLGDVPLVSFPERILAIVGMPLGLAVAMTVASSLAALLPGLDPITNV